VKTYNQISVGLLEMSSELKSMKSMRKTRRSSRQVVLDELELVMRRLEQIKNMVDKHCVAPTKEPSVRSQIVAHLQSKAQAQTKAEEAVLPLTPIQEEAEPASMEEAAPAPEEVAPEEAVEPSKLALAAAEPAAPKRRKSGGCPGGPKAYNEFVKKWLAEQRAAGREMTYQEALKEIKQNNIYTQSCGLPPKKNKTRKLNKTPGRVNAPYVPYVQNSPNAALSTLVPSASLAPASIKERGKSLPPTAANLEKQESERKYLEEGIASRRAAREAEADNAAEVARLEAGLPPIKEEATPSPMEAASPAPAAPSPAPPSPTPSSLSAVSPAPAPEYEDLGMNDNLGMRKIRVNGRQLLMTNGNSGLFEDMNGAPGEFVGYLKNGKVAPSSPPEL
jgi:hypothetical protein